MIGPFVHHIDPVLVDLGSLYLWWYGLSYVLGFIETHLWLRRVRNQLGLTVSEVYSLTIYIVVGVLAGGRAVEVIFYEWPYYKLHVAQIPAAWLGGMATHGVLLGGVVSTWLFCRTHRKAFLSIADELAIPAAFLMATGRIGNFIDGQIVGPVTHVWWAVKFPDAEGFRHPVVLYDSLKNLLVIPILLYVRRRKRAPGTVTAHFIVWYSLLRIFVDVFREYPTSLLGIPTGQFLNIVMALSGACLLIHVSRAPKKAFGNAPLQTSPVPVPETRAALLRPKQFVLAALLLFALTLPSDSTQDVPARYAKRHSGMRYSALYPRIQYP
jgi:phosphatidylglycerol:prolipoprotein diacylglycerol transferase